MFWLIYSAGGTQRLPRIVGKAVAKELILTGRKIIGKDAMLMGTFYLNLLSSSVLLLLYSYPSDIYYCIYETGLVNHCVPAGEAYLKALQVAREMNEKVGNQISFEDLRKNC